MHALTAHCQLWRDQQSDVRPAEARVNAHLLQKRNDARARLCTWLLHRQPDGLQLLLTLHHNRYSIIDEPASSGLPAQPAVQSPGCKAARLHAHTLVKIPC